MQTHREPHKADEARRHADSESDVDMLSCVKITIPPIIYNKRKTNYIDYSLLRSGYKYIKREVSSILFLEDSIEKNVNKFKPSHRQALRKAQRAGLVVNNSDDFNSFYNILKNNLSNRHNVKPTHSVDELFPCNDWGMNQFPGEFTFPPGNDSFCPGNESLPPGIVHFAMGNDTFLPRNVSLPPGKEMIAF